MIRYTHSHTAMKSALSVQHGSSGDSHPIVQQLQMMVMRMIGSNGFDSTRKIVLRRGSSPGFRKNRAVL